MHHPNLKGCQPWEREPFVYIDGVCLFASALRELADKLDSMANKGQANEAKPHSNAEVSLFP
jgi:hypothetical protein